MRLTPAERDRLLLFNAAQLARARRARGLRLNVPEADAGRRVLGPGDVLDGVPDVLGEVQVEAVFEDGSRLAVVTDPIGGGSLGDAAPGRVLPAGAGPVEYADVVTVEVANTSTVPISVSSHFHFFEVNPRLRFDRAAAYGRRAAVPAGSTFRFDPGTTARIPLTPIGGARIVIGFAGLVDGPLDAPGALEDALRRAHACGYLDTAAEGNAGS